MIFIWVCLCRDQTTGDFHYYRRPNVSAAPILFERRYGHLHSFRHQARNKTGMKSGTEHFLGLNKHVRYKRHVRWSPVIVEARGT